MTVVIPTYNEAEGIGALLAAVRAVLPAARLLVVDDRSPDGTGEVVREVSRRDPRLELLSRPARQGLGPAYIDGFRQALRGAPSAVIQMDADFSHRPEHLPGLLAALAAGADLALGSRYVAGGGTEGWPWQRRLTSRLGSRYASAVLGLGVRDATGGFRCWRSCLLEAAVVQPLRLRQFGFQIEMAYRARLLGARVVEVPIRFPDRRLGQSKMRLAITLEALLGVWRLRLLPRAALVPPPAGSAPGRKPL
ncbi:MAG: polyprenol monophosphomannose synthase [Lentisphaerae bacterium]|nr:polyprenol monophosphomannose synthase [Lentisphaerota bacterium]